MSTDGSKESYPDKSKRTAEQPSKGIGSPEVDGSRARFVAALSTLDKNVIPRLVRRFGATERTQSLAGTAAEVSWMTDTLLRGDIAAAAERIDQLSDGGWRTDQIYLDLLGGTCRRLGEFWAEDRIDFSKATIAAFHVRDLMEELAPSFRAEGPLDTPYRGRLLLSPVTGEQHTVGAKMAAAFFERAGWDVIFAIGQDISRFSDAIMQNEVELVGLSIGSKVNFPALKSDIQFIKRYFKDRNRQPPILVGGALISEKPDLARECGADGFAVDAAQALIVAQGYLPSFRV